MPVGRRFDFQLGGKGFLLARGEFAGRAWSRTGRADTPSQRSVTDAEYGTLPDELDHPEAWNDWSGGFGHAYRETGQPTYHWGENFDARFPRQLVHCQAPIQLAGSPANDITQIAYTREMPDNISKLDPWVEPQAVFMGGGYGFTNLGIFTDSSASTVFRTLIASRGKTYQPIFTASHILVARTTASKVPYLHNIIDADINATWGLPYLDMVQASDRIWVSIGGSGNYRAAVRGALTDVAATANLTATLLIGNSAGVINRLAVLGDQLIAGLNIGLFAGDRTGTFVNVLPITERSPNMENFRDLMPWNGGLLAQSTGGLWFYQQQGAVGAAQEVPIPGGRSPIKGYVRALGNCGPWAYAGLWTGSSSYILASQDIGVSLTPRWHPLWKFSSQAVGRIFFDGITKAGTANFAVVSPRLYAAMDGDFTASAPVYYWPVPFEDDNPLVSQVAFSANYIGSAQIDLGNVNWGAPSTPKIFRSVEVTADMLLSGYRYADVYYDVDQSGSFTLLGRANTSPKTTLYFSTGEGSFVTGQSIELRLASTTLSPAFTPAYREVILRGALQPRSVDMITAVVRIADNLRDRQGNIMRSGATQIQELRDFGNPDAQGTQAHQLIDLAGATQWVKVLGRVEEQEMYQEGDENPEMAATVKMAVLTFS